MSLVRALLAIATTAVAGLTVALVLVATSNRSLHHSEAPPTSRQTVNWQPERYLSVRAVNGISAARAGAAASGFLVRPPVCSGPISLLGNAEMRLLTGFRGRLASGVLIGSAFAGMRLRTSPAPEAGPRSWPTSPALATIQKRAHAGD